MKKPPNVQWIGFTPEQSEFLDFVDFVGNNGWSPNGQADEVMPKVMREAVDLGLTVRQVQDAMMSIGYDRRTVHQLQRWHNKAFTGKFGR